MVRSNQDHWQQPTRPGPIWRTPAPVVTVPDANSSSSTSEHCRCNGSSTSDLVALLQSYDDLDYSSRHPLESSALPDAIAISPQSIAPSHLPYQYVPHQYSTSSLACAASLPNIAGTLSKLASRYLPSSTYTGDSCSQRDARSKTSDPGDVNLCPLPSEFRCRQLMAIYFQHYNATLRIIHEPVFWQRFNEVWTEAEPATDAFCYVLLTAMSCVRCLEPEVSMTYDWDGSSASREAEVWIKQVQRWDKRQGLKHATLEMLQVKCLLMLSMKINLIKMRAHYTASQTLLATAIAMGYHKDLGSTTDQTSFYDREMRRRLWFAVTELELAECTEKGIQSLVENLSVTVGPPSNVDDASFDDHSTFAPPEQPDQVYTDSSPARHCSRLQPTRYRVIAIANDAPRHASLSPGEIADIHEQLVSQLDETLANGVFRPATADRDSAFGKTVLQLLLHESLILLHLPFALTSPGKAQNYQSRLVCQESARSTIELHADLQESGLNQAAIPRTYLQRAVLVLCRLDALSPIQSKLFSPANHTKTRRSDLRNKIPFTHELSTPASQLNLSSRPWTCSKRDSSSTATAPVGSGSHSLQAATSGKTQTSSPPADGRKT